METEIDKIVKGVKMIVEEELRNCETSLLSEIRLIEQTSCGTLPRTEMFSYSYSRKNISKLSKNN